MALRLICSLPESGVPGTPRGLFYYDTPEGHAQARQFAQEQDKPGFGVFECANPVREDLDPQEIFASIVKDHFARRQP